MKMDQSPSPSRRTTDTTGVDPNNIGLIATDLDGTFLGPDQLIPKSAKETYLTARSRGIHVVVATGRSYVECKDSSFKKDFPCLQLCPGVYSNGQIVVGLDGEYLYNIQMSMEDLNEFAEFRNLIDSLKDNIVVSAATHDSYIFEYNDEFVKNLWSFEDCRRIYLNATFNDALSTNTLPAATEIGVENRNPFGIYSMYFYAPSEKDVKFIKQAAVEFLRSRNNTDLQIVQSGPHIISFMPNGVSKGSGLKLLTDHMIEKGVLDEEKSVLCLGDADNDLPMMRVVDYAIAMANASKGVLDRAHEITKSNCEGGWSHAISRLINA